MKDSFSELSEEQFRAIADLQAEVAARKRGEEMLRRLNADLIEVHKQTFLILHTAEMVNSSLNLDPVLERLANVMAMAIGVPFCVIYIKDFERGTTLVPRAASEALSKASLAVPYDRYLDPKADPVVGEALRNKEPTVFHDVEADRYFGNEAGQTAGVRSILAVPIQIADQMWGIVLLGTLEDRRHFPPDEMELVWGIANWVALATDIVRLYEETRKRLAESQGIQRVARGLLQKIGLQEVLEIICAEAQQLTRAAGSVVLLEENGWLRVACGTGMAMTSLDRFPVEGSFTGAALRSGEPFLTNDPASEALHYFGDVHPTSFLAVPLRVNESIIGALGVVSKPGGFTQEDVRIAGLFADQAAVNIEHARLVQQAEQLVVLEERQRLARELHDSVIQSLYGVTLYADAAALALAAGKKDVTANHLQELRDTAQEAMRDMRLLIFELHPPVLEKEGLVTALQARLAAVETRAGLKPEFRVEGERRLPLFVEQELYRIAQEALNNVLKHARAQHVTVYLQFAAETVCLEVCDDGAGFDPLTARNAGGVGLHSIEERAAKVGGKSTIESKPGDGTKVRVEIANPGEAGAQ